ncbi:uncharacterized protein [Pagrus major]|uniref:uncharacterized protein n=1 Tax=Pagrus major TaxID=143350 RepID=UPI003CC8D800
MRTSLDLCVCLLTLCGTTLGRTGASPEPYIATLYDTKGRLLLQCEVRRVFPKPKVEWWDNAGNILPAEEPQVSKIRGSYYVTLIYTVTKTGRYRCVATQEDISHQTSAEIYVVFNEDSSREVERWRSATIVLAVLVAVFLLVDALMRRRYSPLVKMLLYCRNIVKDSPLMNKLLYCRNIVKGYHLVQMPPRDDRRNNSSGFL